MNSRSQIARIDFHGGLLISFVILTAPLYAGWLLYFSHRQEDCGRQTAIKGHLEQYRTLLLIYHETNGIYPTTEQGLAALTSKPTLEPIPSKWRMLLDGPILDPFGREYLYAMPGIHNPQGFDLFSSGEDRIPHTADDIGNWK